MCNITKEEALYVPTICVDCGAPLIWRGVDLVCSNDNCTGNQYNVLFNYIKIVGAVKGVSTKIIDGIIKYADWNKVQDVYTNKLTKNLRGLMNYEGFGESAVDLAKEVIEKLYTKIDFNTFLKGLTIASFNEKNIEKSAEDIYKYIETKNKNIFATYTPHIQGVILNNLPYIEEMFNLADVDTPIAKTTVTSTLNVTITGKLSTNRKDFVNALKEKGITEVAIGKADVLICNEASSSSKYKYAIAHKIKIMTENEFKTQYGI